VNLVCVDHDHVTLNAVRSSDEPFFLAHPVAAYAKGDRPGRKGWPENCVSGLS